MTSGDRARKAQAQAEVKKEKMKAASAKKDMSSAADEAAEQAYWKRPDVLDTDSGASTPPVMLIGLVVGALGLLATVAGKKEAAPSPVPIKAGGRK